MSSPAESLPAAISVPQSRVWGRWGVRASAVLYIGLMIALPLAAVVERGFREGLAAFWRELTRPAALQALALTLVLAAVMTVINVVMGTLTAWTLVRYDFPGRGFLDRVVDLPFAIPTLVTGVMLVVLYGPRGPAGKFLEARGLPVVFNRPGILLALLFVCYPFVIRTIQPVLRETEKAQEEAAASLGASRPVTFWRVVLPTIRPAVLTGALLCFGRALGEFGSIVVVAGNIPGRTLTAPVYIYGEIESHNETGASALSLSLLSISFVLLLAIDLLERRRRQARG